MEYFDAIKSCLEGVETRLAKALMEGFNAIFEAKVNKTLAPIYNYCIASGDWVKEPSGEHEVYIRINVSPEIVEYVRSHFKQGESMRERILGKMPFSCTKNSDWRSYKNMICDLRNAYRVACNVEYELAGHDLSKMQWPGRLQKYMDKFCDGRVGWTPGDSGERPAESEAPLKQAADYQAPYPEKSVELTGDNAGVDTTGWDDWKKFQNVKRKR